MFLSIGFVVAVIIIIIVFGISDIANRAKTIISNAGEKRWKPVIAPSREFSRVESHWLIVGYEVVCSSFWNIHVSGSFSFRSPLYGRYFAFKTLVFYRRPSRE